MNKEYNLTKQLIGAVESENFFTESKEKIIEEFKNQDTIMRCYCSSCDSYYELNVQMAEELSGLANINLPSNLKGAYFKVSTCTTCKCNNSTIELCNVLDS
jgi:hypothetical protein